MSGLQCPIALWSGPGLENDPRSSTDTPVPADVEENRPVVLIRRSANTFLRVEQSIPPADVSDEPNRRSLSGGRASVNILD